MYIDVYVYVHMKTPRLMNNLQLIFAIPFKGSPARLCFVTLKANWSMYHVMPQMLCTKCDDATHKHTQICIYNLLCECKAIDATARHQNIITSQRQVIRTAAEVN